MKLEFIPMNKEETKHMLRIEGAKILGGTFRNFSGRESKYNTAGKRNFAILIDDEVIKDALINNVNEFGEGWNVKIKTSDDDSDGPFMFLKVNVKFNQRGPAVYLKSGNSMNRLDEEDINILDQIDIDYADMDIRPYDDQTRTGPFRAAYLQSICVHQAMPRDRFAAMYEQMNRSKNDDDTMPF